MKPISLRIAEQLDVRELSNGAQSGPRIGMQKGPLFGIGSGLSR
ncbi:MAG TPA: hypothetical protein VGM09_31570 [Bradyrhizobium sp.]|jgi:hypothetical protein